jgi:aminopeptidase
LAERVSDPLTDPSSRWLQPLAELAVRIGMNVQPDQVVSITTEPGKEAITRAIAETAYAAGARYVDPWSFDVFVKHSRMLHAPEETLGWVPPWIGERLRMLGELNAAWVSLRGPVAPHLMDDIDPRRLGMDSLPRVPDSLPLINGRLVNWSIVPVPTRGWAEGVFPELDRDTAYSRLWEEIAYVLRLDEDDTAAAWDTRFDQLDDLARRLTSLALDAVHFEGPGTDLTIGLLPSSRWEIGRTTTVFGVTHAANLPTEEVYTAPDPERVDGVVAATRPLFASGGRVEGLRVQFRGGRVVSVQADRGAGIVESLIARDIGAARLGEVALVDRLGRVGQTGTVFYETVLDENAASHIALGSAYTSNVTDPADAARLNESAIHTDFMIGSSDVAVTGVRRDGTKVPLLRGGDWQV